MMPASHTSLRFSARACPFPLARLPAGENKKAGTDISLLMIDIHGSSK
jgi:hypothetical protein